MAFEIMWSKDQISLHPHGWLAMSSLGGVDAFGLYVAGCLCVHVCILAYSGVSLCVCEIIIYL